MKAESTPWREKVGKFLGFFNHHPDHWTHGEDLDDLREDHRDLHQIFSPESMPGIQRKS